MTVVEVVAAPTLPLSAGLGASEVVVLGAAVVYAIGALFALGFAVAEQTALSRPDWALAVLFALLWPIVVVWMGVRHLR